MTGHARAAHSRILLFLTRLLDRLQIPSGSNTLIFSLLVVACILFVLHGAMLLLHQYATAAIAQELRRKTKLSLFERFLRAPFE